MKYEQTNTHRYTYRRMGLVPIKYQPRTAKPSKLKEGLYLLALLIVIVLLPALAN